MMKDRSVADFHKEGYQLADIVLNYDISSTIVLAIP